MTDELQKVDNQIAEDQMEVEQEEDNLELF